MSLRIYLVRVEKFKSFLIEKIFKLKKENFFMKLFILAFLMVFIELLFVTFSWYENSFLFLNEISSMIRILIYSTIGSFSMYFDLQMQSRESE